MKKLLLVITVLSFVAPSISFAATLTPQQSTSLIAVVQSSPGTPASAFVPLITAFSNITINQATSLITVVQASPTTAANAFVDLLISFTVDTVPAPIVTPPTVTPTPDPVLGSEPTTTTTPPVVPPVVEAPPVTPPGPVVVTPPADTTAPILSNFDFLYNNYDKKWTMRVSANEALDLTKTEFYKWEPSLGLTYQPEYHSYSCDYKKGSCEGIYNVLIPLTLTDIYQTVLDGKGINGRANVIGCAGGPCNNYEATITNLIENMTQTMYWNDTDNQAVIFKAKIYDLAGNATLTDKFYVQKVITSNSSGYYTSKGSYPL